MHRRYSRQDCAHPLHLHDVAVQPSGTETEPPQPWPLTPDSRSTTSTKQDAAFDGAARSSPTVDICTVKIHPWSCMVDCRIACQRTVFDAPQLVFDSPPPCARRSVPAQRPRQDTVCNGVTALKTDLLLIMSLCRARASLLRPPRAQRLTQQRSTALRRISTAVDNSRSSSSESLNRRGGRRLTTVRRRLTSELLRSATRPARCAYLSCGRRGREGTSTAQRSRRCTVLTTTEVHSSLR